MSIPRDEHRPLVSGLQVKSGTGLHSVRTVSAGTLTGLATRNCDDKKMLVTNLHVMAGMDKSGDEDEYREPTGDEEMYQGLRNPGDKVGVNLSWTQILSGRENYSDVAMCELDYDNDVEARFSLHGNPHGNRPIIGTREPSVGMRLKMLGAGNTGTPEGTVTITEIGRKVTIAGRDFAGVVVLDCSDRLAYEGDSGSGCFYEDADGNYRLACIVFGVDTDIRNLFSSRMAYAFPASVAERELGITFGNRPPIARAGFDRTVSPGSTVNLDGSESSDPDGDPLTYRWEQDFGSDKGAIAGPGITLNDNTAAQPTFVAPSEDKDADLQSDGHRPGWGHFNRRHNYKGSGAGNLGPVDRHHAHPTQLRQSGEAAGEDFQPQQYPDALGGRSRAGSLGPVDRHYAHPTQLRQSGEAAGEDFQLQQYPDALGGRS